MTASNVVQQTIESRQTSKVFADPDTRSAQRAKWLPEHQSTLRNMIECAGSAPFHKPMNPSVHSDQELSSIAPWRFYVVDGDNIQVLISYLEQQAQRHADSIWTKAWNSKIKNMLAACGALIQVTWLPEPELELSQPNIEHIAAASAATQNLLLLAESNGWLSYWSSGGILRSKALFEYMQIPVQQELLGSIFLSPASMGTDKVASGKLRDKKGEPHTWSRWVSFDN